MIDNQSDPKRTHSISDTIVPKKEFIFKKVRDRLATRVPTAIQACRSRTSPSNELDVFSFPSANDQKNVTEVEHSEDIGLRKLHGHSLDENIVLPIEQTKGSICSSGIKLVGEKEVRTQTDKVLKRAHSGDSGEKMKRRREAWEMLHSKESEHETASNEHEVEETEGAPMLSHTDEDHQHQPPSLCLELPISPGTKGYEIASKENEVVGIECTHMSSQTDEQENASNGNEDQPLFECLEMPISRDNRGLPSSREQQADRLPFMKNVWGIIESNDVFKFMPHFSFPKQDNDFHREGFAIGNMLNFAILAEKIRCAKPEVSRSVLEDMLKSLPYFEKLGFTVHPLQTRLEELLKRKDRYSQLDAAEKELFTDNSRSDELQENISELKIKLEGFRTKREMKASNLAERQRVVSALEEKHQSVKSAFDRIVSSPLGSI
ncbi:hypothetical protein ACHQM5_004012 [Ranunculus cassubicifolius]